MRAPAGDPSPRGGGSKTGFDVFAGHRAAAARRRQLPGGPHQPAYANMIGPYGGITAAQASTRVLQHPSCSASRWRSPSTSPPRWPTGRSGAAAAGAHQPLHPALDRRDPAGRAGRGHRHRRHRAAPRTWAGHERRCREVPPRRTCRAPRRRGVEWLNRYEMRFLKAAIPAHLGRPGRGDSLSRLWVRDEPPRPLDFASLTALADVFFPRVWLRRPSSRHRHRVDDRLLPRRRDAAARHRQTATC
jgi:hypothetical protein